MQPCRHCGRRLKSIKVPLLIGLMIATVILIYMVWAFTVSAHDAARAQAQAAIDQAKVLCSPDTPDDLADQVAQAAEAKIESLDLDPTEKGTWKTVLDSSLNPGGCGFTARHQPKPKKLKVIK